MPNLLNTYVADAVVATAEVRDWNVCRAVTLHTGNFRENANSSTSSFWKISETSTDSLIIPGKVLSTILKFARVRADFDDFDGDRRGIGGCLDKVERELIVTIDKYVSQLTAELIMTDDVRKQQTVAPSVSIVQADVAQAIESLRQKLVEYNRYNCCTDAAKGIENACHAVILQGKRE